MTMAASIKKLFQQHRIPYRLFSHERTTSIEQAIQLTGIDRSKILRTEVLADDQRVILAVVPLEKKINFTYLKNHRQRNLIVLGDANIHKIFADCETGMHPPFGEPYHLQVLLDSSIEKFNEVYFKAGSQISIIQLNIDDFLYLHMKSQRLSFISNEKFCQKVYQTTTDEISEEYMQAIASCELPDLSQVASKVLRLIKQDNHEVEELVNIIVGHEIINDQLLSYAKLPFLAKDQEINTIHDAINHALGFEKVSLMALGVAATRNFNVNKDQHKYLCNFWRHALYCATLAGQLAYHVDKKHAIDHSVAYMVGLFHNFGFLLLSQLFPPEFKLLNKWLNLHTATSIVALEKRLLGMGKAQSILRGGHAKLGAWLLRHWELPEQALVVAKEHHNPTYQGKYQVYVRLIWIINKILRQHKIGDDVPGEISSEELNFLNLDPQNLKHIISQLMSDQFGLEKIALVLAN